MPRRTRPVMIAPFIPLLALLGILGLDRLQGSRYLGAFVVVWCVVFAGLFAHVLTRVMDARRARRSIKRS